MRVCVFGAGAVGGNVAARFSAAQVGEISVVARGAQLDAIKKRGIILHADGKEIVGRPAVATDDPTTLLPQDLVVVTLKATAVAGAAESIARLLAPQGCAIFLANGIPWWWRYGLAGAAGPLPLLDPVEALWSHVRPERALGCVIYSPNDVFEPGVVTQGAGNRWPMGEPDGSMSARLNATVDLFTRAGLKAEASTDIRREVWLKLVRNACGNTLGALTRLGLADQGADPGIREIAIRIMQETLAVAAALGWDLRAEVDVEQVAARGSRSGPRPSMIQDLLQGRALEVEAHLGQTQAFARENGVPVPTIDVVLPLLRGLDRALRQARAS